MTHFYLRKPLLFHLWSCQNVCDALTFVGQHFYSIWYHVLLYRQVFGIPNGTNCVPLIADLLLFCYELDFMMSLSDDKQADIIDAITTTFRYLDEI